MFGASRSVAERLLQAGADPNACTSVWISCSHSRTNSSDSRAQGYDTALHRACAGGHEDIVVLLLQAGAHVDGLPDVCAALTRVADTVTLMKSG